MVEQDASLGRGPTSLMKENPASLMFWVLYLFVHLCICAELWKCVNMCFCTREGQNKASVCPLLLSIYSSEAWSSCL